MARIRSIKPEFWDSPSTAATSLRGRLLYIAMWNLADDYGIGDATPIRLLSFAFPHDDIAVSEIPTLCEEISERFGVVFYEHDGRPFYYIANWDKHQRTERKAKQRIPFPSELENPAIPAFLEKVSEVPRSSVGSSDTGRRKKEEGTGEEGTGEEGTHTSTDVDVAPAKAVAVRAPDRFDEFWDAYGKKVGRGSAEKAFAKAAKKADVELLIASARDHADWHRRNGTEDRFIPHASRWLNDERWRDERTAIESRKSQRQAETDALFDAAMQRAIERDRNAS